MRTAISALFALAGIALFAPATALAEDPATPLAPDEGDSFRVPAANLSFQASTPIPLDALEFYVATDDATDPGDGVLLAQNQVDHFVDDPLNPATSFQKSPESNEDWLRTPGTYYWQTVYHDCNQASDPGCTVEGPIRSFTITPLPPPTPLAPDPGQSFTARVGRITFRASASTDPSAIQFYVSPDTTTDGHGILSGVDPIVGVPTSADPSVYQARTSDDDTWPDVPGTYHWQAVYRDNRQLTNDGFIVGPIRSLVVSPLPPPTMTGPDEGAVIPFGGQMAFTIHDQSYRAGDTQLYLEFVAGDDSLDPDGTFADTNNPLRVPPQATGGSNYQYVFTQTDEPGTYYWMAERFDCSAEPDCYVTGPVRSFTVSEKPPPPAPPKTFLDKHPPKRTHAHNVTFTFHSDVKGAKFQCFYAKQGWTRCSSPQRFHGLPAGKYRFQVRAIFQGKVDPTPAKWRFRVVR
jgi:hypothetical protein